jgi:hypothetical protein
MTAIYSHVRENTRLRKSFLKQVLLFTDRAGELAPGEKAASPRADWREYPTPNLEKIDPGRKSGELRLRKQKADKLTSEGLLGPKRADERSPKGVAC